MGAAATAAGRGQSTGTAQETSPRTAGVSWRRRAARTLARSGSGARRGLRQHRKAAGPADPSRLRLLVWPQHPRGTAATPARQGSTHAPLGTGEISSMFSRSALNRQKGSTGPPVVGKPLTSLGTRSLRADRCAPPQAPAGQGQPPAEGGAPKLLQQLLPGKLWGPGRVQGRNVVSHCPKASSSRQTFKPATFIAIIANIRVF